MHDLFRKKLRSCEKEHACRHGKAKGHTEYLLDGPDLFLSPVLGGQNRSPGSHPEDHQAHDKLDLSGQRSAGKRCLSHLAQHHHIRSRHGRVDQVLQSDGKGQTKYDFQKFFHMCYTLSVSKTVKIQS